MTTDLMNLATQFGAPGFLIAFMIWDRTQQRKQDKDRIATDLEQAKAMTLLAERIGHVR